MAKKKKGNCVYCGTFGDMTDEHIPPKCLYSIAERARVQMHTIFACADCNNGASPDDERFKLLLIFETAASRPEKDKLIDAMAGTIGSNRKLAAEFFGSIATVNTIKGKRVSAEFDGPAYQRVVGRIVRALHFVENAVRLPSATTVLVRPASAVEQTTAVKILSASNPKYLNGGLFTYRVLWDGRGGSAWRLDFFGRHTTYAIVEPESQVQFKP